MFFGPLPTAEALGCRLAHSLTTGSGRVRKGTRLDPAAVAALLDAGHDTVVVARVDGDDDDEDVAATRVAEALAGPGLRRSRASTGRVNLFAEGDGLLLVAREAVVRANRVAEGITLATLAENLSVKEGRLVATVKIIPFAVPRSDVDAVVADLAAASAPPLALAPFRARRAALVHTTLPALRDSVIGKTSAVTRERLAARAITLVHESRCAHEETALARAVEAAAEARPELLLIVGASAIGDRRDTIPAALERAGGRVERFGLPVDPGNLLLIGRLGRTVVLGLPGCARSPRDNGLDRVLDRVACDVPLDADWLDSLAVGGLLGEIVERPAPRVVTEAEAASPGRVGALVLAAGSSRRAGDVNKLLHPIAGEPMVRRVVREVIASGVDETVVVTGHEARAVEDALAGLDVRHRHHPGHAAGMGSSLARGLGALLGNEAVLVCLGDMPYVTAAQIDRLIDAWRAAHDAGERRLVVVPTSEGRRGNPVLIGRVFFDLLLALDGDRGARDLIRAHPDAVREVELGDDAILIDHDTPEELRTLDEPTGR